ncbi:hypothetical protein AX17_003792 [Amanita inopinata Kibby_2008]|nr:hypothetical protein AX17_003792 [Amanita inopinata Kibby_2008]
MTSHFHIPGTNAVYYIPDFVTVEEEEYLIRKIKETPRQKWKQLGNRRLQVWGGEILSNGALFTQPLPSFVGKFPDIISRIRSTGVFLSSPHQAPNHIILNEYLPGRGIMPHEDGPIYHPVVATISLGSHAIFHYYRYADESCLIDETTCSSLNGRGRAINPSPVMSVLLERRSLIITMGQMYTSHLHGIEETPSDKFTEDGLIVLPTGNTQEIANRGCLTDEEVLRAIRHGDPLRRDIRYSLTCRDVVHVTNKSLTVHRALLPSTDDKYRNSIDNARNMHI